MRHALGILKTGIKLQKASKLNILDHFYKYLDEGDWLNGVDLYQDGRVRDISTYEGLISGKVRGDTTADVRIKIQPPGHCIQWIECTCKKNRTQGLYCEHIAAFVIHIERERSELFAHLDGAAPLKPPAMPRKPRGLVVPEGEETLLNLGKGKSKTKAAQTIIQHLKGNIHHVSLINHGPGLRVKIEIKEGQITHYDLGVDDAARFLKEHVSLPQATKEVQDLVVMQEECAELGTRFYTVGQEKVVCERALVLNLPKNKRASDKESSFGSKFPQGNYLRLALGEQEKDGNFLFIPMKQGEKYVGEEYMFFPELGFIPYSNSKTSANWKELPLSRTFKDDEVAEISINRYQDYLQASPIFLDETLKHPATVESLKLSEIAILTQEDGWFRLDPRYGVGTSTISMVDLMKQWSKKQRKYLKAGDAWIKVPDFITQHKWQLDEAGEALKVDTLGFLRLKAALGDFDQLVGSKKLLNQIRNQLEFVPESHEPVVHGTKISLRQYQENGLKWLWWLFKNNLHGLLADEMGLGKTHQAMALLSAILVEKPTARFLVICPTTVLDHWYDKMVEYAPELSGMRFHGPKRTTLLAKIDHEHHTMITSYGVMLRDIRHLGKITWDAVILDEAHFVKNNDTATYQAACQLKSRIRICLTGTPMENHLGELKNLFDFLVPGYLGSDDYFRKNFLAPLENEKNPEIALALQRLIHPFKLRRTKNQVLSDLPEKVEDLRHCSLSAEQIKLYRETLALKASPLVDQLKKQESPVPFLHVFATLTLLKQICNHPALVLEGSDYRQHESGKFELLKELLIEALGSDHKIVIFSQFVGMIRIIEQHLKESGIPHVILTGQSKNRGQIIKDFQTNPEIKVFVGSLLAGGVGIDLTAASVVIHYDRWWNPSKENQATDRVHRIGQNRNVQVLKLQTRGTLEEKIDLMIRTKAALIEKFLDKDEEIFRSLSRQDLIELLS